MPEVGRVLKKKIEVSFAHLRLMSKFFPAPGLLLRLCWVKSAFCARLKALGVPYCIELCVARCLGSWFKVWQCAIARVGAIIVNGKDLLLDNGDRSNTRL